MVKKKGKSKRTTLQDKYKAKRKVVETHRKRRKQAKKDAASGKMIPKKKDPGIPNSWPFKQELLGQIQHAKDRQNQKIEELKEKRKLELRALRKHQAEGGSARTVQELMAQATADQDAFHARQQDTVPVTYTNAVDKSVGQQSRRAYLKDPTATSHGLEQFGQLEPSSGQSSVIVSTQSILWPRCRRNLGKSRTAGRSVGNSLGTVRATHVGFHFVQSRRRYS